MLEIKEFKLNLTNLKSEFGKLPKVAKMRTTIIEIAGYPSWENVISNFLAFYFSDNEHCFGKSLFNAFKNIIIKKLNLSEEEKKGFDFTMNYNVEREWDYIDILITNERKNKSDKLEWAIIVENKIHAQLYNDLKKYWDAVEAKNKIGVVLSLSNVTHKLKILPEDIHFINILYPELIDEWKNVLKDFFLTSDDRHLLYLKDFIQTIESHYKTIYMEQNENEQLQFFQNNIDFIEKINTLQSSV